MAKKRKRERKKEHSVNEVAVNRTTKWDKEPREKHVLQLLVYEWCHSICTVCVCGVMEDKQAMCLTVCLCYSSASEDLGCRRGDFSRKHYGSVELVSPTHDLLICLFLSLCLGVTVSSRSFFSSQSPLPFCLSILLPSSLFCWHVWTPEGDWWVMTYWVWSSNVLCLVDPIGCATHSDAGLCYLLNLQS